MPGGTASSVTPIVAGAGTSAFNWYPVVCAEEYTATLPGHGTCTAATNPVSGAAVELSSGKSMNSAAGDPDCTGGCGFGVRASTRTRS